ncbi:hypothetical protein [uncultured Brevundimonas sp.]|uniref:hypothetical protein n=1 Tax=uncultured Brevundimonas sp. TaxID=213418 RepID=UPI00261EDCAD|nr:hypothetical protein [uncultured Brevundimonas sp.]
MAVKQVSNGNSDGTQVGQSRNDKVGFYGVAPVAQPVVATGADVAAVIAALTALGLFRNT